MRRILNKKAQLSDAMVWLLATIAIVVLLVFFVYASDILGKVNSVKVHTKRILWKDISRDKYDFFYEKTLFAYKLNSNNKKKIEVWIK